MRHRAAPLFVAAALACRHAAPPPPTDRPAAERPAATDAAPPGAPSGADVASQEAPRDTPLARRLSALADSLTSRMAAVRGLSVLRPVARGVMSREAIVERLRGRTREEYPPGELELEGEALKRLGLIPPGIDYERTMFDLLEEQVLGFYDPSEHRLYIADWVPTEIQAQTMAHELTHALQDQHYDIARFTHHERGRGDAQLAAMSVVEGDATAAMFDFALAPSGRTVLDLPDVTRNAGSAATADQPRLAAAPRALRESLLFPYTAGFRLCVERMRAGGHGAIDALLAEPPASSEQVLHADKLAAREAPVAVPAAVPSSLAADHELAWHDVMGEFGVRLVLGEVLPEARTNAGAQGWGGDRAMLFVPRGTTTARPDGGVSLSERALTDAVFVWTVVMDAGHPRDDAEAQELTGMLVTALSRRHPRAATLRTPGVVAARDAGDGRVSFVATRGRTVVYVDRVLAARAEATAQAVLPEAAR